MKDLRDLTRRANTHQTTAEEEMETEEVAVTQATVLSFQGKANACSGPCIREDTVTASGWG